MHLGSGLRFSSFDAPKTDNDKSHGAFKVRRPDNPEGVSHEVSEPFAASPMDETQLLIIPRAQAQSLSPPAESPSDPNDESGLFNTGRSQLLTIFLAATLFSVVTIALMARRSYRQKRKLLEKENLIQQARIEQLQQEKQLMAAEAVLKGQEEERTRLAEDIHDGIGGLLSGVKYSLTNLRANLVLDHQTLLLFQRSLDMLDQSIAELRRVAHNMMPDVLVTYGLAEALKSYCDAIRQSGIINIDFQVLGMEKRIPAAKEIALYRIVQELITNCIRHSAGTHVLVQLSRNRNEISLTVEDNGKGFSANAEKAEGTGLKNLRSRLDYLNGKVDIQSFPGGTSVYINVPV